MGVTGQGEPFRVFEESICLPSKTLESSISGLFTLESSILGKE